MRGCGICKKTNRVTAIRIELHQHPLFFFCPPNERPNVVRQKQRKKLYTIVLEFPHGITRSVAVRASSLETAESRALKRNPAATGIKRNA